jgi:predicted nucleic acid-binding protein
VILLDTSGVLAAIDTGDPYHEAARAALQASRPPRILSPLVLAEIDHLLARKVHLDLRLTTLDRLAGPAFRLADFTHGDLAFARHLMRAYRDLDVGLTDASLVAIAARERVRQILTLDERHFRVLPGPDRAPFRLLPADG